MADAATFSVPAAASAADNSGATTADDDGVVAASSATAAHEAAAAAASDDEFDLGQIVGASKVSFDENGNLVVVGDTGGAGGASGRHTKGGGDDGDADDDSHESDDDPDALYESPRAQQPLLAAEPREGLLASVPSSSSLDASGVGGGDAAAVGDGGGNAVDDGRDGVGDRRHASFGGGGGGGRASAAYPIDAHFPLQRHGPSFADVVSLALFAAATAGFFACAVIATDVADAPSCRDAANWDADVRPFLAEASLDHLRDCTEMVHILSCEYVFKPAGPDQQRAPASSAAATEESASSSAALPMRQVLNLCGGSCQVCGVTWLAKSDVIVGRWALYAAALLAPLLGLAWSRVYLSARNRADVLQFAQYLPGPLFACLALLLVSLNGGVVGHAAATVMLVNAVASFSSASSDRFQAACRAGELLQATLGTSVGQALSIAFGAAASVFFVAWSSVFVSVLARPVDSQSALMLAALFFYAYWVSYVCIGVYIMTLSGTVVALLGTGAAVAAGREQRPAAGGAGAATYQRRHKLRILQAFFCRALQPRQLGVACRWGFVGGTGMLMWTCITGVRSVCGVSAGAGGGRASSGGDGSGGRSGGASGREGCVRAMSLAALPAIQFSHRALLLHVALDGSSVGAARDRTLSLLSKVLRSEEEEAATTQPELGATSGSAGCGGAGGGSTGGVGDEENQRAAAAGSRRNLKHAHGRRRGGGGDGGDDGQAPGGGEVLVRVSSDERLRILDADYYEYAPLIGPGISASFAATLVCGLCLVFFVDAAGATLLLLAAFTATHATTTISLLGVSTVMDAVRMAYLMRPAELRRSYPILHHRLMRLHFIKRQQKQQLQLQQQQQQQQLVQQLRWREQQRQEEQ